jgi:hypothetical protein
MIDQTEIDPLVGDELIEISLHPYHVYFTFSESELQLGAAFAIVAEGSPSSKFDPKEGSGDLSKLWSLVGKSVTAVIWEETICIVFTGGEVISIFPSEGRPRGLIKGRQDMTIEEF